MAHDMIIRGKYPVDKILGIIFENQSVIDDVLLILYSKRNKRMTKEELLNKLNDIEWDDFEVKDASGGIPKSMW